MIGVRLLFRREPESSSSPLKLVIPARAGIQLFALKLVIPAKAGIQLFALKLVIPAKAGIQLLLVIAAEAGLQ